MAREVIRSPEATFDLIRERNVTVLNYTPSALKASINVFLANPFPVQLRWVIIAGESLDPSILHPVYAACKTMLPKFVNMYGITETTVHATFKTLNDRDARRSVSVIGSRLLDTNLYLLDMNRNPVPVGAIGEIYIGGPGVTRGYLNRPELTNERFLVDPFASSYDTRMFKTGDLARFSPEGDLIFLGRNDQQIKVRGFRIETGEVEACLRCHPAVRDALVIAVDDNEDKQLVAYVVADSQDDLAVLLRSHAMIRLPEYMVPSFIVRLDSIPLNINGKADFQALPAPDDRALARNAYEKPTGDVEIILASIWGELLNLDQISRHDSFFALGGHSLLAVRMIERLRSFGHQLSMHDLFVHPVLSKLADKVSCKRSFAIPNNMITPGISKLTPDMLPLIDLTQADIDHIITNVPGGIDNIQDIYALSPVQDGLLFHHLLSTEGDPYLVVLQFLFYDRTVLDRVVSAFRKVIIRHDIMRTAIMWKGLSCPAQVVLRDVHLLVTEHSVSPDGSSAAEQLSNLYNFRSFRMDIQKAPLVRLVIARDDDGSWVMNQLLHHLITDHTMLDILNAEIETIINERDVSLKSPVPFREHIANARLRVSQEAHEQFFREMLADIDTPTLTFGVANVHGDGSEVRESRCFLPRELNDRLRRQARNLNVSVATIFHVAWALVVSRTSGLNKVVFGTVLSGRMNSNSDSDTAMGPFLNTLPIKFVIDDTAVPVFVHRVHTQLAQLSKHELASLVSAHSCSGLASGTPLFNSILNYRHQLQPATNNEMSKDFEVIYGIERTNYPIATSIEDGGSSLAISSQTIKSIDASRVCAYVHQASGSLSECLDSNKLGAIRCIEIIPVIERKLLLDTWNDRQPSSPDLVCIHQMFEQQAFRIPKNTALIHGDESLTYENLNNRANRLAHRLIEQGVHPESLVGICVTVSLEMLIAILAILKAGAAYVPLDVAFPNQRLLDIISDASMKIVIADEIGRTKLQTKTIAELIMIDPNDQLPIRDENPVVDDLRSQNLAYVMYTSGSTGKPKGVMVEHRNIVRLFDPGNSCLRFDENDVWTLFYSIAFDGSVWEIWGALCHGAQLVLMSRDLVRSPESMYRLMCDCNVTILNQTPSAFIAGLRTLMENPMPSRLRSIILLGESFDPSILQSLQLVHGSSLPQIINMYGPTETSVYVTYITLTTRDASQSSSLIGKRLPDTNLYLLNLNREPVPLGVVGEIYAGGPAVTRGYHNRPEMTTESFVPDTFSNVFGARMYKTGDLARYLPDGQLIYVSRNDQQVKVRGFRIETGEVEACLRRHDAVREAVVVAFGDGGDKRLAAYVVADALDDLVATLRSHASHHLPEYMVPSLIVRLDIIPLNNNGKVDFRALPVPDENALTRTVYEKPSGNVEITLASIWSELLNLDQVGRYDSFFALGGHSLLAVRMIERMRVLGHHLTMRDLFLHPTLLELARMVQDDQSVAVPENVITSSTQSLTPDMLPLIDLTQSDIDYIISLVPGGISNIQDIYALSPLQDGILFHHLLSTIGDPYLNASQISTNDRLILDRYITACQKVLNRHDIMRTAIVWEYLSTPAQVVLRNVNLSVIEHSFSSDQGPVSEQLGRLYDPRSFRIDIQKASLMHIAIARDNDGTWYMTVLFHHLIADHVMLELFNSEIRTILNGQEEKLDTPVPFRNHIAHVRDSTKPEEHECFFKNMLADVDTPTSCYGLSDIHRDGSRVTESHTMFTRELNVELRKQARNMDVSLAAICHFAWALVVSRTSGLQKVVFGTVLFGRARSGKESGTAFGVFINTLPIKFCLDDTSVYDCVRQSHTKLAELSQHEHASLAVAQRCSSVTTGTPLFNTLLNYRHHDSSVEDDTIMIDIKITYGIERTNYPISISVEDYESSLAVTAITVDPIDSHRVCLYMQQALGSLAECLTSTQPKSALSVEVLPRSEHELLLETWNQVEPSVPDPLLVHQYFEQQAIQIPQNTALIHGDEIFTYEYLNERANRLAHRLIAQGVGSESLVGICVTVSPEMLIALLAIWKAGAAYVALDVIFPNQRLLDIISDASVKIVITDEIGRKQLGTETVAELAMINPNDQLPTKHANPVPDDLRSQNLAYVLYTSGSTGKPKGVMVEHRSIGRFFDTTRTNYNFDENDVWCLFHSISFDVSVWEIWGAWIHGGKLILMSRDVVRSPEATYRLIHEQNVTVFNTTPSAFSASMNLLLANPFPRSLRYVIFAGESFDPRILNPLYVGRESLLPQFVNMYGTTETTMCATFKLIKKNETFNAMSIIGKRIPDMKIYLLDVRGQPVPVGVVGEIYISGPGVSLGYLNRSDLTVERFISDPFGITFGERMYRTGDLARYMLNGELVYLGRNDQQVKVRGFRIETGEIEACLKRHFAVREAVVVAFKNEENIQLVAYVIADAQDDLIALLRSYAAAHLPDYMVPALIVRIDAIPLNNNGKVDLRALPAPDENALGRQPYEEPTGCIEVILSRIWKELLNLDRVGRHDSFFALGGHSLLAIRLIEKMRSFGHRVTMHSLFVQPVLCSLAQTVQDNQSVAVPDNLITPDTWSLKPDMLPLIDLTQSDIELIISRVPCGLSNIQDIYALSPVQDGILFHHLLSTQGDPYLIVSQLVFDTLTILDSYLSALRKVIERHDILRTAIMWQGLSTPAQVVLRNVALSVTEHTFSPNDGPISEQFMNYYDPRSFRIDVQHAPLIQIAVVRENDGTWYMTKLLHHLISDHVMLGLLNAEILTIMDGKEQLLSTPVSFRNHIASLRHRTSTDAHETFFKAMLADVDSPTICFGVADIRGEGSHVTENHLMFDRTLNDQLRRQARNLNVNFACICHLAWALVVSRTSGLDKIVFGTILSGRTNSGDRSDTALGVFINVLPIKFLIDDTSVQDSVRQSHTKLAELSEHQHTSVVLAQRCSSISIGTPLFNSLLNFRHDLGFAHGEMSSRSFKVVHVVGRTNYPILVSIDDNGSNLSISSQVMEPIDPKRICAYTQRALESITECLDSIASKSIVEVEILPESEHQLLLETWNHDEHRQPDLPCLHQQFERQVSRSPTNTALVFGDEILTYEDLNARANNLAQHFIEQGVKPECLVGVCQSVSLGMLVTVLAILKSGAAYVALDPSYPEQRLIDIIFDASLKFVSVDEVGGLKLRPQIMGEVVLLDSTNLSSARRDNPCISDLNSNDLAYIIYTSGSTGRPKGVMVEHRNVVRLFDATRAKFDFKENDVWCLFHSIAFDVSVWEIWGALLYGGKLVLMSRDVVRSPEATYRSIHEQNVTIFNTTPSAFRASMNLLLANPFPSSLRYVIFAGESMDFSILNPLYVGRDNLLPQFVNMYGPTETTVYASYKLIKMNETFNFMSVIGERLSDMKIYLLDAHRQPVPVGAVGEIYISGPGVSLGYLNRSDLTVERFIPDPFSLTFGERMYRTGDLARYMPNGELVYLGRNDLQVKVRGFRIEPGEIEACLKRHHAVREAVVVAFKTEENIQLVAYVIADADDDLIALIRSYAATHLPDYMVPSLIVRLDIIPLNINGKVDTQALPAPDENALARNFDEKPTGNVEIALASIWGELLNLDQVSRYDSFFALGGHSLLAVRMIGRMRVLGHHLTMHDLFVHPTLLELAQMVQDDQSVTVPENVITSNTQSLTPDMLPLIDLTQSDIDHIISLVPGGITNVRDIYALSPLQDGMLFHHLLSTIGDPYLIASQISTSDRSVLDRYITACQKVLNRHDIMRTAIVWERISTPAQVVLRNVNLTVIEHSFSSDQGPVSEQLGGIYDPRSFRLNIQRAPLMLIAIARDNDGTWYMTRLFHHLIVDHLMFDLLNSEIQMILNGQEEMLSIPVPFRNYISHVRYSTKPEEHERFFKNMLADVDTPTLCYGLSDIHRDGSRVTEARFLFTHELNEELRKHSRHMDVSLAAICHFAWALVVSRTSGLRKLVFGTVLLSRTGSGQGSDTAFGVFINTLPIKFCVDDTLVHDCVRQSHSKLAELSQHEHASLALAQRCSCVTSGTPLFNTLLNYRHNNNSGKNDTSTNDVSSIHDVERSNYPITMSVENNELDLAITALTADPIDPHRVCLYMWRASEFIAECLTSLQPKSALQAEVLSESERELLLGRWNDSELSVPDPLLVHQYFEQQAHRIPENTALIYGDDTITYGDINKRANRLAHRFIEQGVGAGSLVGICVTVSPEMLIAILAICKAGAAYVPLDVAFPNQRLLDIISDASIRVVVTDEIGRNKLRTETVVTLEMIDPNEQLPLKDENPVVDDARSQNLAYVIYTSGSTGKPKGVMVEHRNVARLFNATRTEFNFDENDVWCLFHSIAFDVSVWEIWGAWFHGGKLVIMSRDVVRSPEALYRILRENHVTVLNSTPSAFNAHIKTLLANSIPKDLRYVALAGESLDPTTLRPLLVARGSVLPRFINFYGTTETTVHAMFKEIRENDSLHSTSIIGTRLADLNIYLLGIDRQPVPLGAVGEIYIGGPGVTRGYLNRPELTMERFIPDLFSSRFDARMYKTGDLARYLPNGELIYMGRNDQQVKVRGFRIETGEVEACFRRHYAVREVVVVAFGDDGDQRLVAYVVVDALDDLVATLKSHASHHLPEYMVPSLIVQLDIIPLNNNGKVDFRALPAPDQNALARNVYEKPSGNVEITLAFIWGELLNLDRVSRYDSFFALGGHSLLAVRMIERMRVLGHHLTMHDLFVHPTLSELAQMVQDDQSVAVPENVITSNTQSLTPDMLPLIDLTQSDIDHIISLIPGGITNIQDIYALSPLQDGILFHHLLSTIGDPYLNAFQIATSDRSILDRYVAACRKVLNRHDIMRTAIVWDSVSTPAQVVLRNVNISVIEHTFSSDEASVSEQLGRLYDPRSFRIDIQKAPLMLIAIACDNDGTWYMTELFHHLIVDHVMLELFNSEIQMILKNQEEMLDTPVPFRNYIAYARYSTKPEEHERFFKNMLADVDTPTLSYGLSDIHRDGSRVTESSCMFTRELNLELRKQARHMDVSLASICHFAWASVVSRTSGLQKVVFGTVLLGRAGSGQGSGTALGVFINTLPIKFHIDDTSVYDCVRQSHTKLAELSQHEHASLALAQRCSSVTSGTPLFNTLLNYRHNINSVNDDTTTVDIQMIYGIERTNYPITMSVEDYETSLAVTAITVDPIDSHRVCSYMQRALESLVECLTSMQPKSARSIEILPKSEHELQLETWNNPEPSVPDPLSVHQYFEQQAIRIPNNIALIHGDEYLTYKDLNNRANRLAHRLIGQGVHPECLVGICVSISPEMLVAILAICKSGAAYVPLDVAFPNQRLSDIISDASIKIVITDEIGRNKLQTETISALKIIDPNDQLPMKDEDPVVEDLRSQNLVYVMYTSGSTGKPKGVMVEHRNLARLFDATRAKFNLNENDVWCLFHSVAFDISVWEIWGAWIHGGKLVLMSRDVVRSPAAMHRLMCEHHVTVLNTTPSAFVASIDTLLANPLPSRLRFLMFGGESLDPSILQPLFVANEIMPLRIFNMYGPTETTVHATSKEVMGKDTLYSSNVIGKHLPDTKTYLLGTNRQPVPLGAVGEVYIGGPSVTRGYLNRPDLTMQRFVSDPFSSCFDSRMYGTGDLARYLPDGNLVFIGRDDQLVNIRGYRVELAEIEACLMTHSIVHQAAVVSHGDKYETVLTAYVVTDDEKDLASILRAHLLKKLPDYMIPSGFVHLEALPLTVSGKLDRKALPVLDDAILASEAYEPPMDNTEAVLASIWSQLLSVKRVGRTDNFFALGGHSLLAIRMVNLVLDRGFVCTINDLFQYPTLKNIAAVISQDPFVQRQHLAVPIRIAGSELPIFFVPTGYGDFSHVFSIAEDIEIDFPIYALPWPNLAHEDVSTMEKLACKMILLMRAVQPVGPYRLCGYSSGGILAHAISVQLQNSGELIGYLGLIDTPCLYHEGKRRQWARCSAVGALVSFIGTDREEDLALLSQKADVMSVNKFIAASIELGLISSNLTSNANSRELGQRFRFFQLTGDYEPQDLVITTYLYKATEPSQDTTYTHPALKFLNDFSPSDWTVKLPNSRFEKILIPGDHLSMMTIKENRSVLGDALSHALREGTAVW